MLDLKRATIAFVASSSFADGWLALAANLLSKIVRREALPGV